MSKHIKINWNSKKIQTQIDAESRSVNRVISNTKQNFLFDKVRASYKLIWLTKDLRIIPISNLENDHLQNCIYGMFFKLRSDILMIKMCNFLNKKYNTYLDKNENFDFFKKSNVLYSISYLRKKYKVFDTLITEAKSRNLWEPTIHGLNSEWPERELKAICKIKTLTTTDHNHVKIVKNKKLSTNIFGDMK